MKSKSLRIAVIAVAAVLIIYVAIDIFLGSIVKAGVNRIGPRITQTRVELGFAHISPLSGSGTLSGFFVGNPKGWTSDKAFYFKKISISVAPMSIFGDHIVVKDMEIDEPEFVYETKIVSNNISELLSNISSSRKNSASEATTKTGKPIKFEVGHLLVKGGKVTVGVGPAAMTVPLPPIELSDVGVKEGGITAGQLSLAILQSVTSKIVDAAAVAKATAKVAEKLGSTVGVAAGGAAKTATEGLKGLLGGRK